MKRQTLIAVLILALALPLMGQSPTERPASEIGSQVISNPSSSTALTVTAGAQWALITVRTAGIHISSDGTAATTSDLYLAPGTYRTNADYRLLPLIRVINSSDGAATVYVTYWRQR